MNRQPTLCEVAIPDLSDDGSSASTKIEGP
jgi:hypothetical protein